MLFGHRGRLARAPFFFGAAVAGMGLMGAIYLPLLAEEQFDRPREEGENTAILLVGMALVLLTASGWVTTALVIKRLHDLDLSGWFTLGLAGLVIAFVLLALGNPALTAVSIIGLLLLVGWLLFTPGTAGPNRFGPRQPA